MADTEIKIKATLEDDVSGGLRKISSAMGDAEKTAESSKGAFGGLGGAVKGAAVAYLSLEGAKKAAAFMMDAYNAAKESEIAHAKLSLAIKGNTAALDEQAKALSMQSTYEDDAITGAQSLLAMYTQSAEAVEKLTPAVLDLAAATGVDLQTAAMQVSRAIADDGAELGRYKIAIDGAAGSTERMDSVVLGITDRFGGQAKAINDAAGGVQGLKKAFGEWVEDVGKSIAPAFDAIADGVRKTVFATDAEIRSQKMRAEAMHAMAQGRYDIAEQIRNELNGVIDDMDKKIEEAPTGITVTEEDIKNYQAGLDAIKKLDDEAYAKKKKAYDENQAVQKKAEEDLARWNKQVQDAKDREAAKWMTAKSAKAEEYNINGKLEAQKAENAKNDEERAQREIERIKKIQDAKFAQVQKDMQYAQMTVQTLSMVADAAGASAEEMKAIRYAETVINGAAAGVAAAQSIWSGAGSWQEKLAETIVVEALLTAQTVAQLATISGQSFATGGIVRGSSYYGDKVQANVNSGEMVLTREQQSTLFNIANGGGGAGGGMVINAGVTINGNADARTVVGIRTAQRKAQEDLRKMLIELKQAGRMPVLA